MTHGITLSCVVVQYNACGLGRCWIIALGSHSNWVAPECISAGDMRCSNTRVGKAGAHRICLTACCQNAQMGNPFGEFSYCQWAGLSLNNNRSNLGADFFVNFIHFRSVFHLKKLWKDQCESILIAWSRKKDGNDRRGLPWYIRILHQKMASKWLKLAQIWHKI